MNKNTYQTVKLDKGEMNVYDFGSVKLHAYKTNDYIDDEVFVLEKNGKAVIIESPCFFDNNRELAEYLKDKTVEGMLIAYHGAGGSFLPEVPKYVEKYTPEMWATLLLPAGVTSEASIRYKDEAALLDAAEDVDATYIQDVLPGKMKYNLRSIQEYSFFKDIKTMFQTVFAVVEKNS